MATKNGKITLNYIAASLGVSKTLVSMVINGKADKYNINSKTQKRVWDKINELNYKPNNVARSLRTGKTQSIGFIVADIANPFYAKLARIIEDKLRPEGYNLVISSSDESAQNENKLINIMLNQQVDGLIIATTQNEINSFEGLRERGLPFVLIDRKIDGYEANYVGVDNFDGTYRLTKLLMKEAYKDIFYLSVTPDFLSTIREREQGYLKAMGKKNARTEKVNFNDPEKNVDEIVQKIIKNKPGKTAIIASNNNVAKYCLKAFKKHGLKIPNDIALVCFDDIELFEFSNPPITAISQPLNEMGEQAADLLIKNLTGKKEKCKNIVLKTNIIERSSF